MATGIDELLRRAVESKASDLHLKVGNHPYLRIDGILNPIGDVPRVKTCRHTLFPPEVAGIQRYVSPPARNTGTFPCTDESR